MSRIVITTDAGMVDFFNATSSGYDVQIKKIGLGNAAYTPSKSQTALRAEQERIDVGSGKVLHGQLVVSSVAQSEREYWISEVGFYSENDTLLFVWSHPTEKIAYKSAGAKFLLDLTVQLADVPADKIQIVETTPELTLNFDKEFATVHEKIDLIDYDVTLNVGPGQEFPTLRAAIDKLKTYHSLRSAKIKMADGTHAMNSGEGLKDLSFPLRLEGNPSDPPKCVLSFPHGSDSRVHGLYIHRCSNVAIDGFRFVCATPYNEINPAAGDSIHHRYRALLVGDSSFATVTNVEVAGFRYGIETINSQLRAYRYDVIGCEVGFSIKEGSVANVSEGGGRRGNIVGRKRGAGDGIYAQWSKVSAGGVDVKNHYYGFRSRRFSYLWCDRATAKNCSIGFLVEYSAHLWNHSANDNGSYGRFNSLSKHGRAINCDFGAIVTKGSTAVFRGMHIQGCGKAFEARDNSWFYCSDSRFVDCGDEIRLYRMSQAERNRLTRENPRSGSRRLYVFGNDWRQRRGEFVGKMHSELVEPSAYRTLFPYSLPCNGAQIKSLDYPLYAEHYAPGGTLTPLAKRLGITVSGDKITLPNYSNSPFPRYSLTDVGGYQDDQIRSHTHDVRFGDGQKDDNRSGADVFWYGSHRVVTSQPFGGEETRPKARKEFPLIKVL